MDFEKLFRPGILKTRPYVPGKPISEVQRELGLDSVVKLASNENPEGPLPSVVAAVTAAAADMNRYPDGSCYELSHAVAEQLGVAPANLIFGNGSNEVADMLIRALIAPGENMVFARPGFVVYPLTAGIQFESGRPVPIADDDRHDLAAMAAAIDEKTKIVVVVNPDNPTGTYVNEAEFRAFLRDVPPEVIVVVDEAYYEYVVADDYPQTLEMLGDHPNLVILRTFSKIHSLAALRVGYGVGHPDLITQIHKTREPFNVNSLAQAAALAALRETEAIAQRRRHNRDWLEALQRGLTGLGLKVTPAQTNFLLVRCGCDAGRVVQELLQRGVIARPMNTFGLGDDALRISVGLPEENERCLSALKEILA